MRGAGAEVEERRAQGAQAGGDAGGDAPAARPDDDCYVLFGTNTAALALYDVLRARGLQARISPTPRMARATCGTSLLVDCGDRGRIEEAARTEGIPIESFARLPRQIDPTRAHMC